MFWPVARWLVASWRTDLFYSHGPLVVLVCAWLVHDGWQALRAAPTQPNPWGVFWVAAGIFGAMAGAATDVMSLSALSLLLAGMGLILAVRGTATLRLLAFPLFYLLFAIPLASTTSDANGRVLTPMMEFAARATEQLTAAVGLHPLRAGTVIRYPNYTMNVVLPCSGMASVVALGALAALIAHLSGPGGPRGVLRIALLMLAAVPVALAANVARITLTAILGITCGEAMATGFMHELSGMFTFALGAIVLLLLNAGLGVLIGGVERREWSAERGEIDPPARRRKRRSAHSRTLTQRRPTVSSTRDPSPRPALSRSTLHSLRSTENDP